MKKVILNSWQENGTLSMINQTQIMMKKNETIYNTEVLKCNHCDYNNAYILPKGDIVTTAQKNPNPAAFKNYTPFLRCITKNDGKANDDAEDLLNTVQYDRT